MRTPPTVLDTTRNAMRLFGVVQVLVRHGFADMVQRLGLHQSLPARLLRRVRLAEAPTGPPETFGQRARAALTELGPTFIKLGQIMSTRPDIMGLETAAELSQLQDNVDALPFDQMRPILEEALGLSVEAVFETFDTEPVASASLGQVYRARLRSGGEVAVKVQRPGVEKIINADLSLMRQVALWLDEHVRELQWLDPPGVVHEFSRSIRRELDFEIEAGIVDQFHKNFEDVDDVCIPKTYPRYCHPRVLVLEWVDGVRVDNFDAYEDRNCSRDVLARRGCEVLCDMVFEHRLFHADPHPGNVFITRDNTLAFLDFGMAGHLEKADVAALTDLFLAIFRQDSVACVNALLLLTAGGEPENLEGLRHEVADFIAFEAQSIVGGGQVSRGLERATEILRLYKLDLSPRFSLLLKSLATIEHLGRQLNPGIDMVTILQPYIEKLVTERYTPLEIFKELQQNAGLLRRLTRQLPEDLSSLSGQLRRGRFRMQLRHEHLDELITSIDASATRIAAGIVIGSLILGGSWLLSAQPELWGVAIAGLAGAGLLGLALVISILWRKRF
jgi:ubiquinone biosynthesis protein